MFRQDVLIPVVGANTGVLRDSPNLAGEDHSGIYPTIYHRCSHQKER